MAADGASWQCICPAALREMRSAACRRFFTAVFTVSDPIDILSYYGNPPKKENRRGIYVADDQPFDKTMAALASNAQPHVTEKESVLEVAETVIIALERST